MNRTLSLYATTIEFTELNTFFNITNHFRFIDIDNLIKINNLKLSREIHQFVLNNEIEATFQKFIRYSNNQCKGIIYHNSHMTSDTLSSLKELSYIERVVLVDYYKHPVKEDIWDYADDVILI